MTTNTRIESDTLGPVEIPETALWGPQTERSRHNFQAGPLMPLPLIKALLQIKKAAARANVASKYRSPSDQIPVLWQPALRI